jgi:hypothetical protein
MLPTFIQAFGRYVETFETIIWEWDETKEGDKRGKGLHQIHYRTKERAEKIHRQIVESLKRRKPNASNYK